MGMEPLVSICCLTYNHEQFIRQCLNGILIQKTNFLFEILIHDDASTDATVSIIKEYEQKFPQIIKPIYQKENQYRKGIFNTLMYQFPRARGKYIAFCEGDDYWTDEYKLQRQIVFLEANPNYSMCCHRYRIFDVENNIYESEPEYYESLFKENPEGIDFDFRLNSQFWLTQVLSVVMKKQVVNAVEFANFHYFRDVHLFYYALKEGKGYCMNFFGGVYNKHYGGIFSKTGNKIDVQYSLFRELYMQNKSDIVLKKLYESSLMRKVYTDVLIPTTKLKNSLTIALEPLLCIGDFKTSYQALKRIFRDRLWRIKNALLS